MACAKWMSSFVCLIVAISLRIVATERVSGRVSGEMHGWVVSVHALVLILTNPFSPFSPSSVIFCTSAGSSPVWVLNFTTNVGPGVGKVINQLQGNLLLICGFTFAAGLALRLEVRFDTGLFDVVFSAARKPSKNSEQ